MDRRIQETERKHLQAGLLEGRKRAFIRQRERERCAKLVETEADTMVRGGTRWASDSDIRTLAQKIRELE